jgi:methylglyoxal synthase
MERLNAPLPPKTWLQVRPHRTGVDVRCMKTIALIAHDGKKDDLVRFARAQRAQLDQFHLIATGTTGERLNQATSLPVERMLSGPYGGDAQIAARVAEGQVVAVLFFVDPLYAHPHEPDIQGLLRICDVHNIPLATNEASARLLLRGLVEMYGEDRTDRSQDP